MGIGDVVNPPRPRNEDNQRVDTIDAQDLSLAARLHLDALLRAVTATPRAAGGSNPVGFLLTGFGLTLNPTSGSDNKVRIGSSLGVAIDANGRLLIKEAGTTVDLTLPGGTSQIYAYYIEDPTDLATRRFIAVASPYAETGRAINTTLKSDVAFYVRAGDATSIVASDAVNGQTVALCLLGVVTNTAGAITCTGYDATNAPNGSFITNRLTTASKPGTAPTLPTKSGTVATIADLMSAIAYYAGQVQWSGGGSQTSKSSQLVAYSGNSTSVSASPATLNDTSKNFVTNELVGGWLKDSGGIFWPITSNTATSIVCTGTGPSWWWNSTTNSNTIPNGPPASGAYTVYAPVAGNNYGAHTVGVSAQVAFDWLAQYNSQPHTWGQLQTFTIAPLAPDYKFNSAQTMIIPAAMAEVGSGVTNPPVTFPIPAITGMTIVGYGFLVYKASASGTHLYGVLLQATNDSASTAVNADSDNAVGPSSAWGIDDNSNSPGSQSIYPIAAPIVNPCDNTHEYYLCIAGSDASTPAKGYDAYGNHKRWNMNSVVDFVLAAYVQWVRT